MKGQHVLISASAGSGKTYQLVHHFIGIIHNALLAPDQDRQVDVVDRILAATFTRAAAGEIIERILKRLAEAMLKPDRRRELSEELGCPPLSQEQCGVLLAAVVTKLHRLRIGTLDSFLIRSAQAFSSELGLPADWSILDDAADDAVALEAIDRLLTDAADDPRRFEPMVDLLIGLHENRFPLQVRRRLMKHLRGTQAALSAGPARAWEVIAPDEKDFVSGSELAALTQDLATGANPFIPRTNQGTPHSRWTSAIQSVADNAAAQAWEPLLECKLIWSMAERSPSFSGKGYHPKMIELLAPLRNHAGAMLLGVLRDRNLATRALLTAFVQLYRDAKARRSAFRFDDFTTMLLEANVTESLADFYFRLDAQIDHALLDEFQDTSIPQWKLLHPLVDEIMSGGEGRGAAAQRTFFCVGDVKQTLYGWRKAEPQLLGELTTLWPDLKPMSEKMSRRSAPVIIKTVNEVFGTIVRNPVMIPKDDDSVYLAEAAATWAGWFEPHDTVKTELTGFCRLISCAEGEDTADLEDAAIRTAVERVKELHRADPTKEIAILLRRKKFISRLLADLRPEIRAAGEGGSPLADDMAVCAMLSLLHLIDHPSDSAAVFHVGSSPLGEALGIPPTPASDDTIVLKITAELRAEIMDRGLGAAINLWFARCAAQCDARNFRRLQRLIETAHGYRYDGGDLRPFIDTVRSTNVEDSEVSKVRVMTIHAAKGREFDYVILPDLDSKFGKGSPEVLIDRPSLLAEADCITLAPSSVQRNLDKRLGKMTSNIRRRQVEEELCTLYVAMTRAKSGLEMIVHPPRRDSSSRLTASPAGVLVASLARGAGGPQSVLWTHPLSVLPAGQRNPDAGAAASEPLRLTVAPAGAASRLRPVVAPSSLHKSEFVRLDGILSFPETRAMDRGSVFHRWFQMIEWLDGPLPSDLALRRAAAELEFDAPPANLADLITQFRKACAKPNLRALLTSSHYLSPAGPGAEVEVWRERPFAVPMKAAGRESAAVVSGQIDRAVIVRVKGKVTAVDVIDIKTDRVDDQTIGQRIADYAPQIQAYGRAIAHLLAFDEAAVTARLAFVGSDRIVDASR